MPNSNYRNGRALEYKVIKDLRNKGLEGLRTAGSHGVADIVAYHPRSLTDGLVDILRPQEMVQVILDGWMPAGSMVVTSAPSAGFSPALETFTVKSAFVPGCTMPTGDVIEV